MQLSWAWTPYYSPKFFVHHSPFDNGIASHVFSDSDTVNTVNYTTQCHTRWSGTNTNIAKYTT